MRTSTEPTTKIVRGRMLRYAIVLLLDSTHRQMTVAEIVDGLAQSGMAVEGRQSKVIPDALRWEIRRGRVRRTGRGCYAVGHVAKSTRHLMRRNVARGELDPW
jgi:hypothetical protein